MNTNILSNLVPGGKPGKKNKISSGVANKLVSLLEKDYKAFAAHMHSLSPKDFCETYLKLMKLVMPKQPITLAASEPVTWQIIPASSVTDPE